MFEESYRIAPGIGVLLHLGACLELAGKTASAWVAFQEAVDRARAEGDSERERLAQARVEKLRDRLSYLTVRLRKDGDVQDGVLVELPQGTDIRRDGDAMPTATLGLAMPVDPGIHDFVVRVPGMLEVRRRTELRDGERSSIDIVLIPSPPLANVVTSLSAKKTETVKRAEMVLPPKPPQSPNRTSLLGWVGWTFLGVSAVGFLVGGAEGYVAYGIMREARAHCVGHPKTDCPKDALELQDRAKTPATIANIGVGVGVAGLVFTGGYLLLTGSSRTVVTASLSPTSSQIFLQTRF